MTIAIIVSWTLCAILTATDVFSESSPARTDARSSVLSDSPWFRVPYPGIKIKLFKNINYDYNPYFYGNTIYVS